jgi:hypothetical protein
MSTVTITIDATKAAVLLDLLSRVPLAIIDPRHDALTSMFQEVGAAFPEIRDKILTPKVQPQ